MFTWCIPRIYVRLSNLSYRTFAAHMTLAFGLGNMRCKLSLAEVGGSYIRGIHQISIYSYNTYANRMPFLANWCIFSKLMYM